MIKVTWKLNGRSIAPNRLADEVKKLAFESADREIRQRVQSIRCPVHHQSARLFPTGSSVKGPTYRVQGCCDQLTDAVNRALQR